MKILHTVEFYPPSRGGAQEVIRQLSERLAARGHEVTVATTRLPERTQDAINGVRVVGFDVSGNAVRGLRGEVQAYQEFLRQGQFDVMLNYAAQQWTADAAFPVLEALPYGRIFVPCGFSALYAPAYQEYFTALPAVLRRYQRLVFHASRYRDIDFARQHGMEHLVVIPNGAGLDEFSTRQASFRQRYTIPEQVPLLLSVGSHTGAKGHRATIEAFRRAKIGPAVLVIIGNTFPGKNCRHDCHRRAAWTRLASFGRKQVLLLAPPRSEVIAAYQAATLFVFASNIEYSPLVLYEAMAAGVPFIASPAGNTAEIIEWTGGGELVAGQVRSHGWIEVNPGELARAIERLLGDPQKRQALGQAGQAAWRERFTWENIVLQYEQLYQQVARGDTL